MKCEKIKNLLILLFSLITSTGHPATPSYWRLPDRDVANQYRNENSCWQYLCSPLLNPQFVSDVKLLHKLLTSLKITSPNSLRELFLKYSSPTYNLSPHIKQQLHELGFLKFDGTIRHSWHILIMLELVPLYHIPGEFESLHEKVIIEDIARKYPHLLAFLHPIPTTLPEEFLSKLVEEYGLLPHRENITPETLTRLTKVAQGLSPIPDFGTLLSIKSLQELFVTLGIIVDYGFSFF